MEELISILETEIALQTKHLQEDNERINDPILGQFFRGRSAVEEHNLETFKRIFDIVNRMR